MTEALVNGGKALNEAISHAIDWVKDVRRSAGSVNRVADALIEDLRRGRIKSKRLTRAAKSPLSIGIFGISQAGIALFALAGVAWWIPSRRGPMVASNPRWGRSAWIS